MSQKEPEHVKYENAPEEWADRCSGDGYDRHINEDGDRVFSDNNIPVGIGVRPCAKCDKYPTLDGDDACLGSLGAVMNACCGHGKNKGYIQFDNGVTVRGYFEMEYSSPYDMPYKMRSRKEIFDRIEELEGIDNPYAQVEQATLKWVMGTKRLNDG